MPAPESLSAAAGMHRFVWDLHDSLPKELRSPTRGSRRRSGPWAPPGRYIVRLTRGGKSVTQPLVVVKDPRLPASVTDADLVRQYELARGVQAERVRVAVALRQAASLRKQIEAARDEAKGDVVSTLDNLSDIIDRTAGPPNPGPDDEFFDRGEGAPTSLRRLASSLGELQSVVESADAAPTPDALTGFSARMKLVSIGLARWSEFLGNELPGVNSSLRAAQLQPLRTE